MATRKWVRDGWSPIFRSIGMSAGSAALICSLGIVATFALLGSIACGKQTVSAPAKHIHSGPEIYLRSFTHSRGRPLPARFFGLSIEAMDIPALARDANQGNLVNLLRSLGPGVLRLGAFSGDHFVAWSKDGSSHPSWAQAVVTADDLAGIAALARKTNWKIILEVSLAHFDPESAAQEADIAFNDLGPYLMGIEIGNEPNGYNPRWSIDYYLAHYRQYLQAIHHANPKIPIVGPDVITGSLPTPNSLGWIKRYLDTFRPSIVTQHYYPLTDCGGLHPTISELLSPGVAAHTRTALREFVSIARSHHLGLRLDETNNISCDGQPGTSNTFAAALWFLNYFQDIYTAGASGINLHDYGDLLGFRPTRTISCTGYSPLCAPNESAYNAGIWRAQPEWYGLLLASRLVGARKIKINGKRLPPYLTVSGWLMPNGDLSVLLLDPGRSVKVGLNVGKAWSDGHALNLTAKSLSSTSGIRLGGTGVTKNGSWTPNLSPLVRVNHGRAEVRLRPHSATLVTFSPNT